MSYLRYADRIYNCPLLITSEKARMLEQVIRAHEEGRASLLSPAVAPTPRRELALPGVTRTDGGYLRTADGIAIIQSIGTFVQRSGDEQLDAMSGLVAYSSLSQQMQTAGNDPRIGGVLWEVDSNGGEVSGIIDAVATIRAVAAKKPVWAIANEKAFSAGMWTATAAGKLFAAQTAMVGSIGVRMLHVDQSQRDAKQGLVYTEIVAGARKADFSPHAPLSDAAMATAQAEVDRIYAMFVQAVADHRGIDPQTVRNTEAGLLAPMEALAIGLIDGIQSFDETLAQLTAEAQHVIHGMRAAARAPIPTPETAAIEGANIMTEQVNTAATAAQLTEAETRGRIAAEADTAKQVAVAQAQAAKDAQSRISAILTHAEATGRRTLAEHLAFKTTSTVEEAAAMLAAAPKEAAAAPTNLLAAAMKGVNNPVVGADAGTGADGEETAQAVGARIAAAAKRTKLKAVQ